MRRCILLESHHTALLNLSRSFSPPFDTSQASLGHRSLVEIRWASLREISSYNHLNSIRRLSRNGFFLFILAVCGLWGRLWCLIRPFLCLNSKVNHGAFVKPEFRLLRLPHPGLFALVAAEMLTEVNIHSSRTVLTTRSPRTASSEGQKYPQRSAS